MVIGKEALFVIMGLKRLNIGGQKLKRLKQTTDYCIQKSLRREKKTCKRCSSFVSMYSELSFILAVFIILSYHI
ncbi:hypothetical protein Bca101_005192 [Brassica carinata]